MVHIRKSRSTIYRQFELDVWGYYNNASPSYDIPKMGSRLTKWFQLMRMERWGLVWRKNTIFIYRIDVYKPRRKRRRMKWRFVFIRMLKFFYMSVSHRQFRRYGRRALRREGFFVSNYLLFLEGRLASVLYRMNFVSNIFTLRQFVTYGHVIVGLRVQTFLNFNVGLCEAVRVQPDCQGLLEVGLFRRLLQGRIYFNTPRYMYVNYQLMFGFLYCEPGENDVAFPIGIDVYRGMDHI